MEILGKLLVVARVAHYRFDGKFWAYTPYAREIDVWADLFREVAIAGTLRHEKPPADCAPFGKNNVVVLPVAEAGGDGWKAKFKQAFILPQIVRQLSRYMCQADAIHVRCPCDLGLLGILLAPFYSRRLIAKYATQWLAYCGEPLAWRIQRRILSSAWWTGPVTVYGKWPDQPKKVTPFFTSMLTNEQVAEARKASLRLHDPKCLRILFVGRLSKSKNVNVLLQAISSLELPAKNLECFIVGEGLERRALEELASQLEIRDLVTFTGGLTFDEVIRCYERADVLVLASEIEGWPKAIAEGMAYGLVCIGTARGMVPQMLGEKRGLMVPPGDARALCQALRWISENPDEVARMRVRAADWAQKYSLDGLREALRQLTAESWPSAGSAPLPPMEPKEIFSK